MGSTDKSTLDIRIGGGGGSIGIGSGNITSQSSQSSSSSSSQIQNSTPSQRKKPPFWVHFTAGGIGGMVGATLTCPLELVKTRLQSSMYRSTEQAVSFRNPFRATLYHVSGTVNLLKDVARKEGIKSLWRGLGPTLVGVVPARAIYFASYSRGKHLFSEMNHQQETPIVHMAAAATAGAATVTMTSPIWLIKTRMQLQSNAIDINDPLAYAKRKYKNSFHCLFLVIKEEGFRGLYRGLSASLLGTVENTLQFVTYEYLRKKMLERRREIREQAEASSLTSTTSTISKSTTPLRQESVQEWIETFLVAAVSKLFASMSTYPHEVLRTRLRQTPLEENKPKYTGLVQAVKLIYKEEGMTAFYGGMTAHLMRVVPNAAIMLFCYEAVVAVSEKWKIGTEDN